MSEAELRLRHLVAGTDLSESSRGAVGEALRLGALLGATVSVVHIAAAGSEPKALEDFVAGFAVPAGLDVRPVVRLDSRVAAGLASYAQEIAADLLVVGPRVRGFVERHITGSIAEQLMSKSAVPMLATAGAAPGGYRRVLVAIDHSEASARALRLATLLQEGPAEQRRLIAFHALGGRGASAIAAVDSAPIERAMVESAEDEVRAFVAKHVSLAPEQLEVSVRVGAVGHVLPEAVIETAPDLVCMGTVGRTGLAGLLAGNAAERMARRVALPLLVAHP